MSNNVKTKDFQQVLLCELTDCEKLDAAQSMAKCLNSLKEIEADKKTANAEYKARTEAAEGSMSKFSNLINSGVTSRNVACTQSIDYDLGTFIVRRNDNQDIIENRDLTESEKQMQLPLDAPEDEQADKNDFYGEDADGHEKQEATELDDDDFI